MIISCRRNFVICFLIVVFSLTNDVLSYQCAPAEDCENSAFGTLVPDPDDCHTYYLCVNRGGVSVPTDVPLICPTGEYFDQTSGACTTENTTCTNACARFCNLECQYELEFIAYPGDCGKYYLCLPGAEKIPGDCPADNPYFNGTDCSTDIFQCCDSCVPYCTTAFVQIPDPTDCTKFYICLVTGEPSESTHQTCPTGQHFDTVTSACVAGSDCTTLCVQTTPASSIHFF